ncbi:hypothetical protein Bca52824_017440 [Brassica carinata]|uniref:Uncharacterized protein n=1 Tax=Brassica carinata TaxID=52824 RepID=A0A8X8AXF8_BRACI|nr:hypothetical protein Bca52824_017440 [Brassica carinata]
MSLSDYNHSTCVCGSYGAEVIWYVAAFCVLPSHLGSSPPQVTSLMGCSNSCAFKPLKKVWREVLYLFGGCNSSILSKMWLVFPRSDQVGDGEPEREPTAVAERTTGRMAPGVKRVAAGARQASIWRLAAGSQRHESRWPAATGARRSVYGRPVKPVQ